MRPRVTRSRRPAPETPGQRKRRRRRDVLDLLLGGLGFFAVMVLVATVVAEVRGDSALTEALVLLCFVVLIGLVLWLRRRV